jgi:hypothetical protein
MSVFLKKMVVDVKLMLMRKVLRFSCTSLSLEV